MTFDEIKDALTPEESLNILMLFALCAWAKDAKGPEDANKTIEDFGKGPAEVLVTTMNTKFANVCTSREEGLILAAAYLHVKEAVDRLNDLEY